MPVLTSGPMAPIRIPPSGGDDFATEGARRAGSGLSGAQAKTKRKEAPYLAVVYKLGAYFSGVPA